MQKAARDPTKAAVTGPTLFLDFDGVLHPIGTPTLDDAGFRIVENSALFQWLPELARALAPAPKIAIVVSSDWSLFCDDARFRHLLGELGARYVGTIERELGKSRAERIWAYVEQHAIKDWLVVDDDPSVRDAAENDPRFVSCDPERGVSEEWVLQRIARWVAVV